MCAANNVVFSNRPIKTWKQFGKYVRCRGCSLLRNLDNFESPVLVAGCQRSGTTAIARMLTTSEGMFNYWFGRDDELDAALILSGEVQHEPAGRYCFQTTYLNQCYSEYLRYGGRFRLIWIVRNPHSVIYSMLHNWGKFAFNELFDACGSLELPDNLTRRYKRFGQISIPRLTRACFSYNAKTSQIHELRNELPGEDILILDYDDLVSNKDTKLETIYRFIDLPYQAAYADKLHVSSLNKASRLSEREKNVISEISENVYQGVKSLAI